MDTKHFFRRAISRLARETLYRRMDDSAAFEILARTTRVLDGLGLRWWLTDGTLLGFVRERGFIGHDIDVDLGLPASAYSPELEAALEAAGLELYGRYGTPEDGLELTVRGTIASGAEARINLREQFEPACGVIGVIVRCPAEKEHDSFGGESTKNMEDNTTPI